LYALYIKYVILLLSLFLPENCKPNFFFKFFNLSIHRHFIETTNMSLKLLYRSYLKWSTKFPVVEMRSRLTENVKEVIFSTNAQRHFLFRLFYYYFFFLIFFSIID
jgi:hypothetical protein